MHLNSSIVAQLKKNHKTKSKFSLSKQTILIAESLCSDFLLAEILSKQEHKNHTAGSAQHHAALSAVHSLLAPSVPTAVGPGMLEGTSLPSPLVFIFWPGVPNSSDSFLSLLIQPHPQHPLEASDIYLHQSSSATSLPTQFSAVLQVSFAICGVFACLKKASATANTEISLFTPFSSHWLYIKQNWFQHWSLGDPTAGSSQWWALNPTLCRAVTRFHSMK